MGAVGISEQVPSGTTSNHHLLKQDSLNSVSPKMATFASCYREVQIWKGNFKKKTWSNNFTEVSCARRSKPLANLFKREDLQIAENLERNRKKNSC